MITGVAVLIVLSLCGGRGKAHAEELLADVCVVGGGSGGIGTAIAAARAGATVILVEKQPKLGGTSARAYVCSWEPGPGSPLAKEIYQRLKSRGAVGITEDHNADRQKGPFGLWRINPELTYEQTLNRAGRSKQFWHGVSFDPDVLHDVVSEMLAETGRCRVLLDTTFTEAKTVGPRVKHIAAVAADGTAIRIHAKVFVDCTGGVHLCRAAGCEVMLGAEPKNRFGELSAPEKVEGPLQLNAISLCYRVRPSNNAKRQDAPSPSIRHFPHSAHVHELTNGDRIVNPLGLLPGHTLIEQGYDKTYEQAQQIVQAHWHWLQQFPEFASYEFVSYAPLLGIRESYRVVGEHVLRQEDLQQSRNEQPHTDIIAYADHAMDVHGANSHCRELKDYYGVPYRCLIPKNMENLLVACRGASMSQIAASSCRLNRTMMALGHAAGLAAVQAVREDINVRKVNVTALQPQLGIVGTKP